VNSVKNIDLTKSVFVALLLVSTVAGADDKYPASDFQPQVVFQDETAGKQAETSAPAKSSSSSVSSGSDSQYPAANFEPKVVYADESYKHSETISNSGSSSASSSSATSATTASAAQKDDSSVGYLLGLIVLGIAGFVLFKKGAGFGASAPQRSNVSASGLTGVARYVLKTSGTGVSRYLEKNAKSSATAVSASSVTGVAKYLAGQTSSAKETAGKVATGVEKYMRNKG
jgi:hypothetical protein